MARVGDLRGLCLHLFLSALLRAVAATLAPEFSAELQLAAGDLGLLAGAYFLGFSSLQLPLGWALDRYGAAPGVAGVLVLAVLGCAGFALARSFGELLLRALIGVGVSASLMAPLTAFRGCSIGGCNCALIRGC